MNVHGFDTMRGGGWPLLIGICVRGSGYTLYYTYNIKWR